MPSHSYQTDDASWWDLGSRETREILHVDGAVAGCCSKSSHDLNTAYDTADAITS